MTSLSDEDARKIAKAVVREREWEALRIARSDCISEDQVEKRMREWRKQQYGERADEP